MLHTTAATLPPRAEARTPAASLSTRVRDTFVAPSRLARGIADSVPVFDVLAVVVLVAIVALYAVPDEFYIDQVRDAVDRRGRAVEITSDPAAIARWNRYLAMLTALVQWPMLVLGAAGLLHLLFGLRRGSGLRFAALVSLSAHAFLIFAAQRLLVLGASLAGVSDPSTSLAVLLPGGVDGAARSVLELVDPFTIWMLVVLGIGVATLGARLRRHVAVPVLIGGYLLLALALGVGLR